jgi:hypothetical protein
MVENYQKDSLAEATGGKLHWSDPGMDDYEQGYQDFTLGMRVEVRYSEEAWVKGTVVGTLDTNGRAIEVEADEKVYDNLDFNGGKGLTIAIVHNTRRGILSKIREIFEEPEATEVFNKKSKKNMSKKVSKM